MATGRFAPTPSGPLHVGNLRTALVAWLSARSAGSRFVLRLEDLAVPGAEAVAGGQVADLDRLGIDHDGPVISQLDHPERYTAAIAHLEGAGLTYPCYCSRREVREAGQAPHGPAPEGVYPGTCRDLSAAERKVRSRAGRPPALRLRSTREPETIVDRRRGPVTVIVDDLVLLRGDGVPSYNLAVVVDDAADGVAEVVRGDDLLLSSPRQAYLARTLGLTPPAYAHVPLVLGPGGDRLAKRDGAVTLAQREARGDTPASVRAALAASLGLAEPGELVSMADLVGRFDPDRVPGDPWQPDPSWQAG